MKAVNIFKDLNYRWHRKRCQGNFNKNKENRIEDLLLRADKIFRVYCGKNIP